MVTGMVGRRWATILAVVWIPAASLAQLLGNPIRTQVGVGAQELGLGNNVVAAVDDASALFWNPAGAAFADRRQIQLSVGGFRPSTQTTLSVGGEEYANYAETQRIRPGNAAILRPFSTP
ncbi:MAG: hypothetical protein GF344_20825, partial [Chitinivibrionales bacterium]|nr:hypothetical protein [Chitinivibrionales bacterium]MBD3359042.1 hypothetical protein [Chitinivibrionales bacterium]